MRIPINLASQPYVNSRPLYNAVWIAATLGIGLALLVIVKDWQVRNETRLLTEQVSQLQGEMTALRAEQQELEQWLGTPQVQAIRAQSAFLNSLIDRKSLSWTRIFMDLEKILPPQAQITAIQPSLNQFRQAQLNLSVAAVDMGPLIQFLKNLESSRQFGSPVVESQRFPSERAKDRNIVIEVKTGYFAALVPETSPPEESPGGPASPAESKPLASASPGRPAEEGR